MAITQLELNQSLAADFPALVAGKTVDQLNRWLNAAVAYYSRYFPNTEDFSFDTVVDTESYVLEERVVHVLECSWNQSVGILPASASIRTEYQDTTTLYEAIRARSQNADRLAMSGYRNDYTPTTHTLRLFPTPGSVVTVYVRCATQHVLVDDAWADIPPQHLHGLTLLAAALQYSAQNVVATGGVRAYRLGMRRVEMDRGDTQVDAGKGLIQQALQMLGVPQSANAALWG